MKIDIGRTGPALAMRCDIHLDGEDDPPYVRIYRGGVIVAEIAASTVADDETMAREVLVARRLEMWPEQLRRVLVEMIGDFAGFPGDGSPEKRRAQFAEGFVAALRGETPGEKRRSQTWLKGFSDARELARETSELYAVYRDRPDRIIK
jgi:hypothetical protein